MNDPKQTDKDKKDMATFWMSLSLVFEIGFLIAIPAFLFGFGGAYLDKHIGSSPIFLILGLLVALLSSSLAVLRKVKAITSRF